MEEEMNVNLKENRHAKKVNTAVSFNTIKNMAFELFMKGTDSEKTMEKMTRLFKMNPSLDRLVREPQKRKKTSDLQAYNFQRRNKKHVF